MTYFVLFDSSKTHTPDFICQATGRWAIMSGKFRNEEQAIAETSAHKYIAPESLIVERGRYISRDGKVVHIHYGPVVYVDLLYGKQVLMERKEWGLVKSELEKLSKTGNYQKKLLKIQPSIV